MQKATRQQIRSHNSSLVLRTIYQHTTISRASIARLTNLSRATVSDVVAELLEENLVAEVGIGVSAGGKPPTLLSFVDDSHHLIGLDLAGDDQVCGAVIDLRGRIKHRLSLPLRDRTGEAALAMLYELIDGLLAVSTQPLLGIGIGGPGLVDADHGIVHYAVNFDWHEVPLAELVRQRYDLPVYVANDAHAATLGEYTFGAKTDAQSLVVVLVGRGIRAGIVLDGALYYGEGYGAGEIGHVVVDPAGDLCVCGHRGCLEAMASTKALVRQARAIVAAQPASSLARLASAAGTVTTDVMLEAYAAGDPAVVWAVHEVGCYLGIAIANLVGALNVRRILVAGSMARFGEGLLDAVHEQVRARVLTNLAEQTTIDISALGADVVVLGTAALLLDKELSLV